MSWDEGARFELQQTGSGPRHFLAGRAVHSGDTLKMEQGGQWISVQYECNRGGEEIYVMLVGEHCRISPDKEAVFRWPGKGGI